MEYHTSAEKHARAQQFIAEWATHRPRCEALRGEFPCSCGFFDAVRELQRFCTDQDSEEIACQLKAAGWQPDVSGRWCSPRGGKRVTMAEAYRAMQVVKAHA